MEINTVVSGVLGFVMLVISFVTVWVKIGARVGSHERTIKTLEDKTKQHDFEISNLEKTSHGIQLEITEKMTRIETKLDVMKEDIAAIKGGRRAAAKQN